MFFIGFILLDVPSYHPMPFPGKIMNQTWKNDKKPNLRPILAHLAQISFFFEGGYLS